MMLTVAGEGWGAALEVQDKDIVLATFGGSIGLTGLLLVFQGYIISAYRALPGTVAPSYRESFRWAARAALGVLFLALCSVSASLTWLLIEKGFGVVIGFFSVSLVAVLVMAIIVSRKLVG